MFQGHEMEIFMAGISLILSILWYLLRQKDEAQAKQITELWNKHNEDAAALRELERIVDREHYVRKEVDDRFAVMETSFKESIKEVKTEIIGMRGDFKQMSEILTQHVLREDAREEARFKMEQRRFNKEEVV